MKNLIKHLFAVTMIISASGLFCAGTTASEGDGTPSFIPMKKGQVPYIPNKAPATFEDNGPSSSYTTVIPTKPKPYHMPMANDPQPSADQPSGVTSVGWAKSGFGKIKKHPFITASGLIALLAGAYFATRSTNCATAAEGDKNAQRDEV